MYEITHQLSFEFVDDIIGHLAAVIVAFVYDRPFFVLLSVIVPRKICVAGTRCIRQPDIRQLTARKLVDEPAIVLDPRSRPQTVLIRDRDNGDNAGTYARRVFSNADQRLSSGRSFEHAVNIGCRS